MQKLLFRRTLRQLKSNIFRYIALFLLVIASMAVVIGVVGGAQSVVMTVEKCAEKTHLEDGQFGVFVPLSDMEISEIEDMTVTVEKSFFLDFALEDDSTLRVMKNREQINQVEIYFGHAAESEEEIVVERIFAMAHGYSIGDRLTVGNRDFTICGFGTSSDYDACLRNMSDMSADGNVFGTAFVAAPAYDALLASGKASGSENYRYAYRIVGSGVTNQDLKDYLKDLKVAAGDVRNIFFQEFVKDKTGDRDEMLDGVAELNDSSGDLDNAIADLRDGTANLNDGIQTIYDGMKTLSGSSGDLRDSSAGILSALSALEAGTSQIDFSTMEIEMLKDSSAAMLSAAVNLKHGLEDLENSVNYDVFKSVLAGEGIEISTLPPEAQTVLAAVGGYLDAAYNGIANAADGAEVLIKACELFNGVAASIPESVNAMKDVFFRLSAALAEIHGNYKYMDGAIGDHTDALDKLYNGFDGIRSSMNKLSSGAADLADSSEDFVSGMNELMEKTDELSEKYFSFEVDNLTDFVIAEDNLRIKASSDDVLINVNVGTMTGVIVLILIAYVISVFTVHSIESESAMIGTLYALGLKRRQLMLHYTMLPVALCLAGGAIGTLLGFSRPMINLISGESIRYYSTPTLMIFYNPMLVVYGLAVPPLTAFVVNILIINKRLKRPPLTLLRKEPTKKTHTSGSGFTLNSLSFPRVFQIRQFLREKRSCFAVMAGIFISLLILVMGINCYVLCRNVEIKNVQDTKYEYMYQLKYPEKTPPADAHVAFVKGLKKEVLGYEMEISVIGLSKDNPFFPVIGNQGTRDLTIADSAASKYGLQVGDEVVLRDEVQEKMYAFRVKAIVPYAPGLCAFMDIVGMRELFGQEEDYYNTLYSDHELNIDSGRIYAVSTRADIKKSAAIFSGMMFSLVATLTGSAVFILVVVLYQMTGVMIDRASTSISLMKVFGYRNREIRMLYLDGNLVMIAVGMLFLLPLSKFIMDAIYPTFVANVACGTDYTWHPALYAVVYFGTLLSYLFIRSLLMVKLKKLTPAEVLQNRE